MGDTFNMKTMNNETKAKLITTGIILGVVGFFLMLYFAPMPTIYVTMGLITAHYTKVLWMMIYEGVKDRLDNGPRRSHGRGGTNGFL